MTENKNVFTGSVCAEAEVSAPDGWRLVPITPTSEMIAALKPVPAGSTSSISSRYTELVLAAPTLTSSETVTTKPQRITEQDAREIIRSWGAFNGEVFEWWCTGVGKIVLAKLNEHREPDYKAQRDELLDPLKSMVEMMDSGDEHGSGSIWHTEAKTAIAKVNASNAELGKKNDI